MLAFHKVLAEHFIDKYYGSIGYKADLKVQDVSSVFRNDHGLWGAKQALTPISDSWVHYWHSAAVEVNPWITFRMEQEDEVKSVELVDRQDCCHERFKEVEVRIGRTNSFEDATSCGKKSYEGQTSYK